MRKENYITPFEIKIYVDGKSHRLSVTHPSFIGRIRPRIGNGSTEEHDTLKLHLKVELEKHFRDEAFTKESVESFIDQYIDMYYKGTASIFDYFYEFYQMKEKTYNKRTKYFLTKSSLQAYTRTKELFHDFTRSFYRSDILILLPIYAASEKEIPGINSKSGR